MQINNLEDYFGCKLFNRKGKNVFLTPAGVILKKYVENILDLHFKAKEEIDQFVTQVKGELKIGASMTIGGHYLPNFLSHFSGKYPDVKIKMIVNNTEEILFYLMEDILEIGIVEGEVNNVNAHIFAKDEMVVVVPAGHELADNKMIEVEKLCEYPLITREKGSGTRKVLEIKLKEKGILPNSMNIVMELGSTEAIKGAIKAGLGIAVLSRWTVREEVQKNIFKEIYLKGIKLNRTFKYIYNEGNYLSVTGKIFLEELQKYEKNSKTIFSF